MLKYSRLLKFGKLMQQLTQFGLDPAEWQIQNFEAQSNVVHMRHRKDPSFSIAGIHNDLKAAAAPAWKKIYVTSI